MSASEATVPNPIPREPGGNPTEVGETRWRRGLRLSLQPLRYSAAAFAIFVSLQYTDDALCAVINAGLFLLPLSLLLALCGRRVWSLSGASAFAIFLYGMGELKNNYFGNRLAIADWEFIAEPVNWSVVWLYPRMYTALSAFLFGLLLLALDAALAARRHPSLPAQTRLLSGLLFLGLVVFMYGNRHHHTWEVWRDDADCGDRHTCGIAGRLMYSFSMFEYEPPAHAGDPSVFLARKSALAGPPPFASEPTDVVVWLNESTFDPRNYKLPGAKLPKLPMFDRTPRTRAMGAMRTHTFGGKTWLSEFSMLTGLVPDDFGALRNLVFTTVGPNTHSNMFRLFKANDYKTVVLMPTFKRFYGAGRTYVGMGVDEVLTLRDFREYDTLPGDAWDIADTDRMAEAAINLIKRHRGGPEAAKPLFLYLLSVKEHAPYSRKTKVLYNLDHSGLTKSMAGRMTDYIGRLRTLDAAVKSMDDYLGTQGSRHSLFAYFGDHQAYFDEPSPPYRDTLPDPDHVTQFQIRANFAAPPTPREPLLDIAFVPSLVVDFAGVRKDDYFSALTAMRQLCGGLLDECADEALLQSYKAYVFSPELNLFEK